MERRYMNVRERIRLAYQNHYADPREMKAAHYGALCRALDHDLFPFLPQQRELPVVEIGSGYGHTARYLLDRGFSRVSIVDICPSLIGLVKERIGSRLESATLCDGTAFLQRHEAFFGAILAFDLIEHYTVDEAYEFLRAGFVALRPGGVIVLRTPNMANLLGTYSLYKDHTHMYGYTDGTLEELLRLAGFGHVAVCNRKRRRTVKGQLAELVNRGMHRALFCIQGRSPVRTFDTNIIMMGSKVANGNL
jgi:2-polyprenyl-3-methyl-5-hydroxy-6-metoxy-1,4-benzoquinol methylase